VTAGNALLTPDLCIIGAGAGGLSVAAAAGMLGVPTVLVERAAMGGECLNVGCVPSKALIAAARQAHAMRHADRFGLQAADPKPNFARVNEHVREVIAAIAPNDSEARFGALGVTVIKGDAAFEDARTLSVADQRIRPRRFVLAIGSKPAIPDVPGLGEVPYLTNETLFSLTKRPNHLIILGGGPIGMEMAQAHVRLGCRVSLIQKGRVLPREEAEAAAIVARELRRDGVEVFENASAQSVQMVGQALSVDVKMADESRVITGSHLLVATGRRFEPGTIGLDRASVVWTAAGIATDTGLRTTNRRIFAIGDATDSPHFTHVANMHAGVVLRRALFRLPAKVDHALVPRVTFTAPEVASVGLTEEEARKTHRDARTIRWPIAENDRSQAERETTGLLKAVVDRKGRILGVSITATGAGEMIMPWVMAMAHGKPIQSFTGLVFPYPIVGEATKRAATAYLLPGLRNPWLQRALRLLRKLG
jgi:pyruvate/2-oxoglutarate dehydrogenase complex dihydrolipoamide dehydrogenase (E3) component